MKILKVRLVNNNLSTAQELAKKGSYIEAINIFDDLWAKEKDRFKEWDGFWYALSLRKQKKYSKCIEVCEELNNKFK